MTEIPSKAKLIKLLKVNNIFYKEQEIKSIIEKIKVSKTTHAITFVLDCWGVVLIIFKYWYDNANDYGTLVHELFHAVDMILRNRQIILSDDSDEVYAYHLGYFVREFSNKLWAKK